MKKQQQQRKKRDNRKLANDSDNVKVKRARQPKANSLPKLVPPLGMSSNAPMQHGYKSRNARENIKRESSATSNRNGSSPVPITQHHQHSFLQIIIPSLNNQTVCLIHHTHLSLSRLTSSIHLHHLGRRHQPNSPTLFHMVAYLRIQQYVATNTAVVHVNGPKSTATPIWRTSHESNAKPNVHPTTTSSTSSGKW